MDVYDILPPELWMHISSFLNGKDLTFLALTSKTLISLLPVHLTQIFKWGDFVECAYAIQHVPYKYDVGIAQSALQRDDPILFKLVLDNFPAIEKYDFMKSNFPKYATKLSIVKMIVERLEVRHSNLEYVTFTKLCLYCPLDVLQYLAQTFDTERLFRSIHMMKLVSALVHLQSDDSTLEKMKWIITTYNSVCENRPWPWQKYIKPRWKEEVKRHVIICASLAGSDRLVVWYISIYPSNEDIKDIYEDMKWMCRPTTWNSKKYVRERWGVCI